MSDVRHIHKSDISQERSAQTDQRGQRRQDAEAELTSVENSPSKDLCGYEWNIESDALVWEDGICDMLNIRNLDPISTNNAYNQLLLPNRTLTRDNKILMSREIDKGNGVEYRLQYAILSDEHSGVDDIWVEDRGRWYSGADGKPQHATGSVRLIHERRHPKERVNYLSRYDHLTGIYNRNHLNFCLENTFREIAETGRPAAFIVVGLEHFDLINSVYGYDAGDAVIAEVAKCLNGNLRENDIVGRFSGAKIGIILPDCDDRSMLIAGYRILNLMRENVINTGSGPVAISISIGGVVIPEQAQNPHQVFVAAQQALLESRRAKDTAIVSYRYDPVREARQKQDAKTAEQIVNALRNGHTYLVFQPIVDAKTGEIQFHEALLRLHHGDGIEVPAEGFVGVAQRLGLIRLVDHHALDLALDMLVKAPSAEFSLNVSNETACDPDWYSKLAIAVHQHKDIAKRLIIEITESHAAESDAEAKRFIDQVRDLGCRVALDDFGAGFTSFRNLRSLPFDIIKVDGEFVKNLANCHINQNFIKALINLAHLFDVKTVVEWVEDEQTAQLLRDWGVDYLQGYEFGKPQRTLPWPVEDDEDQSAVA